MAQNLFQIAQDAQKQLNDIVPGKVTVKLEKGTTGRNELVGYYEQHGDKYMHSQQLMGDWAGCSDLFVSYFAKRKDYVNASAQMQQMAFNNGIHPQAYPEFSKQVAKEIGLYMD
tara:strand:+ start:27 stop:368 length:342 start_codon:yes stop_codon:yes gene_type:complete